MPRHTLLHGPAGTAALEFAACFPDPLVADTDGHAALLGLRHEPVTGPDELHALVERIADGKTTCGTLVVENVSSIFDRLSWAIDEPDNRYWRERSRRWYELVARMRELPCNVVLVAREKTLYAQAGEMVNGRTVGVDESVAIGTTADLERTTEYHFEVTVRLTVDAFTKLRIAHVTTSYLPYIVAGAVGLADTAFVQTLLGPLAVTEPAPVTAPAQAAAPAPAGDEQPAATTSADTAPAPVTAEAEPAPGSPAAVEPAQPDDSNTASASSPPIEEAAPLMRDEMLIDEDELPEPATPPTAAAAEVPTPGAAPTRRSSPSRRMAGRERLAATARATARARRRRSAPDRTGKSRTRTSTTCSAASLRPSGPLGRSKTASRALSQRGSARRRFRPNRTPASAGSSPPCSTARSTPIGNRRRGKPEREPSPRSTAARRTSSSTGAPGRA